MTNLIEKSLLIGFGIFTLTIFTSILFPFLGRISEFNENEKNNVQHYLIFIEQVDLGVNYIIKNPNDIYLKSIEYPNNLNISISHYNIKYEFLIEKKICVKIIEYKVPLLSSNFHEILPQIYLLNISYFSTLIKVNLSNLN
ncbi:MAG: hypothetical protein ACFE9I_05240 [Candidatus Hermodarchaeota archaeon]